MRFVVGCFPRVKFHLWSFSKIDQFFGLRECPCAIIKLRISYLCLWAWMSSCVLIAICPVPTIISWSSTKRSLSCTPLGQCRTYYLWSRRNRWSFSARTFSRMWTFSSQGLRQSECVATPNVGVGWTVFLSFISMEGWSWSSQLRPWKQWRCPTSWRGFTLRVSLVCTQNPLHIPIGSLS